MVWDTWPQNTAFYDNNGAQHSYPSNERRFILVDYRRFHCVFSRLSLNSEMGVNNQLLCGTACVGIVALVVAIDAGKQEVPLSGEGNPPPPDIPGQTDVDSLLADVQTQATRWHQNKALASAEDVKVYKRDCRFLRARGGRMFKARATFYTVDPLKETFETRIAAVINDIEQQSAAVPSAKPPSEKIPAKDGEPISAHQDNTLAGAFNQTSGSASTHNVPTGHQTTPALFDSMVDEFAHQETSVATTNRENSAFKTSPDPLNDAPSKPESAATLADHDNAAGYEHAPNRAVAPVPKQDAAPTTDAPSFETVDEELPEGSVDPVLDLTGVSHEEVLARENAKNAAATKPEFNTTDEQELGADDFASKLQRLRERLVDEADAEASGELQGQVDDILRQMGEAPTPQYTNFSKTLYAYMVKINQYDRRLTRNPDPLQTKKRMERLHYYTSRIAGLVKNANSPRLKKLTSETFKVAQTTYLRNLKKYPQKKTKREVANPGIHRAKRQKTGNEAVRAAAGRQSQTGEPPRKKPVRRSARNKTPVKEEPDESRRLASVSISFNQ